jgi:hypothetical protein
MTFAPTTRHSGFHLSTIAAETVQCRHLLSDGARQDTALRDGKAMLNAFCQEFGVPRKPCGKLLVAANESEVKQADANGVIAALDALAKNGNRITTGELPG